MSSVPLTVILPARNEEVNIGEALASVQWADERIVVDSHSTDRTEEIARMAGAEVVQFDYAPGGLKKEAWAFANLDVRNEWIFLLDADERIPPALRKEIEEAIRSTAVNGYYVDRELVFMGRAMRSFRPNWNLKLVRRGRAGIEDMALPDFDIDRDSKVHEHVVVDGAKGFLRTPLLHDDYRGLTAWLDRHNGYATWEAHLYRKFRREPLGVGPISFLRLDAFQRKRVLRRLWVRLPFRPGLRFLTWYVARGGFLDGREGFIFCVLMSYYEFIIGAKLRELGK
jgi:glycosyltransferase involved in cell wall biosynthesis